MWQTLTPSNEFAYKPMREGANFCYNLIGTLACPLKMFFIPYDQLSFVECFQQLRSFGFRLEVVALHC